MSFVEWYEDTYNDKYCEDYGLIHSLSIEYEEFCIRNNIDIA